jgi:DNA-binding transcriptional LysR family regulator
LRNRFALLQSGTMYEWSDLRIFLAVVRDGSALAASKSLGVNQTTVNRRLQALERDLGLILFDRQTRGHSLTEHGKSLLGTAQKVADRANDLNSAAERLRRVIAGVVRVTSPEETANSVIIPIAAAFQSIYPRVSVEQVAANRRLDIVHGEADLAVRNGSHPDDPRLIAKRLPDFAWTLYCTQTYADNHGMPSDMSHVAAHDYVGYVDGPSNWSAYIWFVDQAKPTRLVSRSNTVTNMKAMVKSSVGVGLLPCFVADPEPDLIRCFAPMRQLDAESWMLTSPEALSSPQVRAFIDFLVPRIMEQRDRFTGHRPKPPPA